MEKTTITVLGVGNILLTDEGFGVRVIEEMTRRFAFPSHVQVLDGGTLGMELLRFLSGTEKLIVIDAIAGGSEAGSLYQFRNEEVKAYFKEKVSAHELGIQDVFAVLELLDEPIDEIIVLGVQPASLAVGLELTAAAAGQIDNVIAMVLNHLGKWQVEVETIGQSRTC